MSISIETLKGGLVRVSPDGVSIDNSCTEFFLSETHYYNDAEAFLSDNAFEMYFWNAVSSGTDENDDVIIEHIIHYLSDIWKAAHLSIKDVREYTGLDQRSFSNRFCIPYDLYMEWERTSEEDEAKPYRYDGPMEFSQPVYNMWKTQTFCNADSKRCPRYVVLTLAQLCGMVDILATPKIGIDPSPDLG